MENRALTDLQFPIEYWSILDNAEFLAISKYKYISAIKNNPRQNLLIAIQNDDNTIAFIAVYYNSNDHLLPYIIIVSMFSIGY